MLSDGTPGDPLDTERNMIPIFYWNWVGMEMNRFSTSLQGPQGGPTLGSRALGLLHLAMHDAWFGCRGLAKPTPYIPNLEPFAGSHPSVPTPMGKWLPAAEVALSAAASTVLGSLYRGPSRSISRATQEKLNSALDRMIREAPFYADTLLPAYRYGECVAAEILSRLGIRPGEPGADQGSYEPKEGRYYFRDEPTHPVRLLPLDPDRPDLGTRAAQIYHGPFYGVTARSFAVTDEANLRLAPPPYDNVPAEKDEYIGALAEVVRLGGAPELASTKRTPAQTTAGLFWAYDGANLIGTPPRLYNQIIRVIAWEKRDTDAAYDVRADGFVRLFALCNAAMADAGKFAWLEKFKHEFWRPLTGVREHDLNDGPSWDNATGTLSVDPLADPFWRTLGAPDTNSNNIAFKPPFPAYPSGHATFGAACFQMLRRYYANPTETSKAPATHQDADNIAFSFVSDELNGASRQLYAPYVADLPITAQPGEVRTRVTRSFPSLKHAIFDNAFSRIFLGVHWRFDAFGKTNPPLNPTSHSYPLPDPEAVEYDGLGDDGHGVADQMVGGIPLGLAIANQIFDSGLKAPDNTGTPMCLTTAAASAATAPSVSFSTGFAVPETKISNTNLR